MAPISSTSRSSRENRRAENQEDIKHLLKEVWYFDLDETFCKIFSIEAKKGIQDVIDMSKEDLREIKWREDDSYLAELMASEVGKVRILKNCANYLMAK